MKKVLFIVLLFVTSLTLAADNTPIKIIVTYSPGGASDIIARCVQYDLQQKLKRPVVIEYKLGAGGDIGTAYVANAPQNETVLLVHTVGMIVNSVAKPPVFTSDNLHHVVTLGTSPMVLVASNKLKIKKLNELATLNKSNITYASAGMGSGAHIGGEILKNSMGLTMTHIPYKGSASYVTDIISGNVDIGFLHYSLIFPYIESGQVVPLAVGSAQRLNKLPDVPTFREYRYYDREYRHWFAIFSNKNASDPTIQSIIKMYTKILTNDITKLPYQKAGLDIPATIDVNNSSFIKEQQLHYTKLLKSINLN